MTIERSHGKTRPTLPRSSDLPNVESERKPTDGRGPGGRFATGNRLSVGAGQKHAVKRLLGGSTLSDGDAAIVARDGLRALYAALRELPSDGAIVRSIGGIYGRHVALSAFCTAKAEALGLDTPEGVVWTDRATAHGQRAERLAVTMSDIASRHAKANARARGPVDPLAAFTMPGDGADPDDASPSVPVDGGAGDGLSE